MNVIYNQTNFHVGVEQTIKLIVGLGFLRLICSPSRDRVTSVGELKVAVPTLLRGHLVL